MGIVVGIYCWLAFAYLPTGAHWTPDTGIKRLQADSLRFHPWLDLTIHYPGRWIDPDLSFLPFGRNFHYVWQGEVYFAQPPIVAILGKPFILVLGDTGERVMPLLAGLASVYLVAVLMGRLHLRPAWAGVLVAGLATPLLFYSLHFWEHTLAAALGLGAVVLVVNPAGAPSRRSLILSGLLAGMAAAVRKEMLFFALCLGVVLACRDRLAVQGNAVSGGRGRQRGAWRGLVLWALANVFVLSLYDLIVYLNSGNALPPELRISVTPGLTPRSYLFVHGPSTLADFVFDFRYNREGMLGNALLIVVLAYWLAGWLPFERAREAVRVTALAALGAGVAYFTWRLPVGNGLYGLLSASPFLAVSLLRPQAVTPARQAIGLVALGFFALGALGLGLLTPAGPGVVGLEWGARYALAAFPLGVPLALQSLQTLWGRAAHSGLARLHLALALGLVGLSVWIQVLGVREARASIAGGLVVRSGLLALPEAQLVTDLSWLPVRTPEAYAAKEIFQAETPDELSRWVEAAFAVGVRRFAYVSFGALSEDALAAAAPDGTRLVIVETRRLSTRLNLTRLAIVPSD
jgi:hypothetical protein